MTEFEKLIIEVEARGAAATDAALKRLDASSAATTTAMRALEAAGLNTSKQYVALANSLASTQRSATSFAANQQRVNASILRSATATRAARVGVLALGGGLRAASATALTFSRAMWGAVAPLVAFMTPLYALKELIRGTRSLEDFTEQLRTVTGDLDKAATSYEALMDFAIQTPYDLTQAVEGFTKLVNFGLNPSERAMRAYGNTASAMGKDLNQMIQAVAMATVNHFVRLKQFGILARKEGDEIVFKFQGVTTRIGANAKEIEEYLIRIGETEFAGAMERRMKTLTGAMSNFQDEWLKLLQNISKEGVGSSLTDFFRGGISAMAEMNAQLSSGEFDANIQAYRNLWSGLMEDISTGPNIVKEFALNSLTAFDLFTEGARNDLDLFLKHFPENFRAATQIAGLYVGTLVAEMNVRWTWAQERFLEGWDHILDGGKSAISSLGTVFGGLADTASAVATRIVEYFAIEFDRLVGIAKATGISIANAISAGVGLPSSTLIPVPAGSSPDEVATEAHRVSNDKFVAAFDAGKADVVSGGTAGSEGVSDLFNFGDSPAATESAARRDEHLSGLTDIYEEEKNAILDRTQAVKDSYDLEKQAAEELRASYDATATARVQSGEDRLKQFWKQGDGKPPQGSDEDSDKKKASAASKAASQEESRQRQVMETRLRNLEEGLTQEGEVLSQWYDEQRTSILKDTSTTTAEKQQLILAALAQGLVSEEQAIRTSYESRAEFILSSELLTAEQRHALLYKLERRQQADILNLQLESQQQRLSAADEFFGNLASIGSTFGEKGFRIAKAAAIAQATIKTYEAATSAYASLAGIPYVGPALGAAAAGAAIVAGAANIAQIKAQEYSGAYAHGGMIPSGKVGLVGEAGAEFIRGPAVVTSAATTNNARRGGGVPKITINNNGAPVEASASMNGDELVLLLKPHLDATRRQTKRELADEVRRGGSEFTGAMEKGYGVTRSRA